MGGSGTAVSAGGYYLGNISLPFCLFAFLLLLFGYFFFANPNPNSFRFDFH